MFSVDPAARLLNQIEPRNGASTAAANANGPMTFGSIVLAAGLSAENISVLRELYFVGVQRAGKLSVFVNCLFDNRLDAYAVHDSKDDLVAVLIGLLPHPSCVSHIFHFDGLVKRSLADTLNVAASCRCAILALSQMYRSHSIVKLEHLLFLFMNVATPQAITIDGALRRADVAQLAKELRGEWSVFFKLGHLLALRGQVRNEIEFAEAVLSLGMVDDVEQGGDYWATLAKFP